jgi:hypothetical protein
MSENYFTLAEALERVQIWKKAHIGIIGIERFTVSAGKIHPDLCGIVDMSTFLEEEGSDATAEFAVLFLQRYGLDPCERFVLIAADAASQ